MIIAENKTQVDQGGILEEIDFSTKMENLPILFHIVRSQLYSDPIKANIVEYSVNARDSHVEAGKPNLPIQVTLPSQLDCFLRIRDFGIGLSEDDVRDVFVQYCSSTKRTSNKTTGCLGIGSKSFASYTDQCMVRCFNDGIENTYSCFIDPSKLGKMLLLSSQPTTEKNGVEIVIPVKQADISKFIDKAFQVFSFWAIKPVILGINDAQRAVFNNLCAKKVLFEGKNWRLTGESYNSYAVVGGTMAYKINEAVFGDELRIELKGLLLKGVIMDFPIGKLSFAASRESLQYDDVTKKILISRLEDAYKEIQKQIEEKFINIKTLWDAKIYYNDIFNSSGQFYCVKDLFNRDIKFNGESLNDKNISIGHYNPISKEKLAYGYLFGKVNIHGEKIGKVKRQTESVIGVSRRSLVVFNDKKIINGIINRVVGLIENKTYDYVYVININGEEKDYAENKKKWLELSKFDGPSRDLSSLPKELLGKYYSDCIAGKRTAAFPSSVSDFVFNFNPASYQKNSDYWRSVAIDTEKDSGIYLEMDRFEIKNKSGWIDAPKTFIKVVNELVSAGITIPKEIYGFKLKSMEKVRNNPNMVNFWVWAKKELSNFLKNQEQEMADHLSLKNTIFTEIPNLQEFISIKWTDNKQSPIQVLIEKLSKISKPYNSKLELLKNICVNYGIPLPPETVIDRVALIKEFDALKKRYPLFFYVYKDRYYEVRNGSNMLKEITNYINLIDKANP